MSASFLPVRIRKENCRLSIISESLTKSFLLCLITLGIIFESQAAFCLVLKAIIAQTEKYLGEIICMVNWHVVHFPSVLSLQNLFLLPEIKWKKWLRLWKRNESGRIRSATDQNVYSRRQGNFHYGRQMIDAVRSGRGNIVAYHRSNPVAVPPSVFRGAFAACDACGGCGHLSAAEPLPAAGGHIYHRRGEWIYDIWRSVPVWHRTTRRTATARSCLNHEIQLLMEETIPSQSYHTSQVTVRWCPANVNIRRCNLISGKIVLLRKRLLTPEHKFTQHGKSGRVSVPSAE